jgi:pimeloyl-ACP methyl ester carboxylesterase
MGLWGKFLSAMSYAAVNRIALNYRSFGSGPPLVLIHGLACGRRMWVRQLGILSRHFRVITYDQRGHGLSSAPDDPDSYSPRLLALDLIGLLDHLQIAQAHIVGFSLGGGPALALAAAQPQRVRSLVLADVGAGSENPWQSQWLAQRWCKLAQQSSALLYEDMLRHAFYKTYAGANARARFHMRALITATPLVGLTHILAQVIAKRVSLFRQTALLRSIAAPTLILRGQHDVACLRSSTLLAKTIHGAQELRVSGAGHMVPLERPAAFNRAVLEFIQPLNRR